MNLSPHFTLTEMCKSQLAMHRRIANQPDAAAIIAMRHLCQAIMEPLRAHFGVPINPFKWLSKPAPQSGAGGSRISQHCKGEAVDFEIAGVTQMRLAGWIEANLAYDQLICGISTGRLRERRLAACVLRTGP